MSRSRDTNLNISMHFHFVENQEKNGRNPDTQLWTRMVNKPPCSGVFPTHSLVYPPPLFLSYCFFSPLSLCRLRALSGGGSSGGSGGGNSCAVASPPLSPALPKYKLADYRYGREEMLALYVKDNKVCEPSEFHTT